MARRIPQGGRSHRMEGAAERRRFPLSEVADQRTPKITLPGPCYIHYRAGRGNISREVYPDLDTFWSDLVAAYHRGDALARRSRLQLSADRRDLAGQARRSARAGLLAERGDDWRDLLRIYIGVINAVVAGAPGRHDDRHPYLPQPGPELAGRRRLRAVAEPLFNDMKIGIYFLEYDNVRAGTLRAAALGSGRQSSWCSASSPRRSRNWKRWTISSAGSRTPAVTCRSRSCVEPAMRLLDQRRRARRRHRGIEKAKLARIVSARQVWGTA